MVVRYVGQTRVGTARRFQNHLAQARRGTKSYVYNWIRAIGPDRVGVRVLETLESANDLNEAEARWVSHMRGLGMPLTNTGAGGDSAWRGEKRPAQSLRMQGEANPMWGQDRAEIMAYARSFNKPMSEERRKELSEKSRGTGNPTCVLTEQNVREIRARFVPGHGVYARLAREYGVTPQNIRCIVSGQTWKHLL